MIRRIIKINEDLCNGCGACAAACHEGAIGMVDGKAVLLKDDYCDGLGDCLPACPTGAISFEEREAAAYDEAAVKARMAERNREHGKSHGHAHTGGCPGSRSQTISRTPQPQAPGIPGGSPVPGCLSQWPVQIKLVPTQAPYFKDARLLVAADCTAFTYGNFHQDFISGRITLIGCPKLDMTDYSEKLAEIIRSNDIKDVMVVRMEVPCCGGIENAVKEALIASGKMIPWQVITVKIDGTLIR
ncbi:MAG: 4Fe-4S binding protein [Clostridiales bacterium]|nr:4Fe-4S binding protein [Clostridiales bacterium]